MCYLQAIHSKVMALSAERGGRRADYTVQSQNSLANGVFLQVNGALKSEVCCCTEHALQPPDPTLLGCSAAAAVMSYFTSMPPSCIELLCYVVGCRASVQSAWRVGSRSPEIEGAEACCCLFCRASRTSALCRASSWPLRTRGSLC